MVMKNYLGEVIYNYRQKENLTQDQYGARYNVSGPAIFKFEKGYVKPSLDLWLKMAEDAELTQHRAVLLWVKSKLPDEFQDYIELHGAVVAENETDYKKKNGKNDYSKFETREQMKEIAATDKTLNQHLREMLNDDALWVLYKPTGHEINMLRDMFGPLGQGSVELYREALRLLRAFVHSF